MIYESESLIPYIHRMVFMNAFFAPVVPQVVQVIGGIPTSTWVQVIILKIKLLEIRIHLCVILLFLQLF